MRTRSIAPGAARWPQEICAPSKAGPVGEDAAMQPLSIAEHDLRVGADVDDQPEFIGEIGRLRQHDAGRVGADMAGDAGQGVDHGAGGDGEAEVARFRFARAVDGERKGRAAELGRVEAEHEMMHDRIADKRDLDDFAALDPGLALPPRRSAHRRASRTARVSSSTPPGFIIA